MHRDLDSEGLTDVGCANLAMESLERLTPAARELAAHYECELRSRTLEDLHNSAHFYKYAGADAAAAVYSPQLVLVGSRDLPATYKGARGVLPVDVPLLRFFLLGVARAQFRDRGVDVQIDTAAQSLFYVDVYITVRVVDTGTVLRPRLVVVSHTPQPLGDADRLRYVTAQRTVPTSAGQRASDAEARRRAATTFVAGGEAGPVPGVRGAQPPAATQ